MVDINRDERVIRARIVYYGPATGGKTTNLLVLHRLADPKRRGELVSVNSAQDRTILLDLLPIKTLAFQGYDLRLQVVAVPGQPVYATSRSVLLEGADAIVFVANSAADRWEETLSSLREMNRNLLDLGVEPTSLPVVFQYNKRDLPDLTPLQAMDRTLNARHSDSFPAVAIREEGVVETFAAVLHRTMLDLGTRYQLGESFRNPRLVHEWARESLRVMFPSASTEGPASEEEVPSGVKVRVPVRSVPAVDGGLVPSDEGLVESYAAAATHLTMELEELRDAGECARRRSAELGLVVDTAREIFEGGEREPLLLNLLKTIGENLGATRGSLASTSPEGRLEALALWNLAAEPLCHVDDDGRQLAGPLAHRDAPLVFGAHESGELLEALDRIGDDCGGLVAVPVRSRSRSGLLTFYLSSNAPLPRGDALAHLSRLGSGLSLVLGVAAPAPSLVAYRSGAQAPSAPSLQAL